MNIKIRRRLDIIDGFVNHIINEHFETISLLTNRLNYYGDCPKYLNLIINTCCANISHYCLHNRLIELVDEEFLSQLETYIVSNHAARIYEEYKKTAHYINNA